MTWHTLSTPQRIEAIKSVWEPGTSARIMAAQLGTTRNAIIGMYTRYREELADHPLRNVVRLATSKPLPEFTPAEYDATALNLTLLELGRRQCKWAMNDPAPRGVFLFCGHATEDGPYCQHHTERSISRASFVAQAA